MHSERKIVSILIESGLHPLQTFQHQTARTGDVDADESFSRGFAIQGTAVDHDFGLMEQLVCEGIAAHAQLTDINPYQISGFQRTDMDGREIGIEEMKEYLVIALLSGLEFIHFNTSSAVDPCELAYDEYVSTSIFSTPSFPIEWNTSFPGSTFTFSTPILLK